MKNAVLLLLFALTVSAAAPSSAQPADKPFLDFPMAQSVAAAKSPAFAWLVKQADQTIVYAATGPAFDRAEIARRSDANGDPIVAVSISPDGRYVAYLTGLPKGDGAFNPASLLDAPKPRVWLARASGAGKPVDLGESADFNFSADSRSLFLARGGDLVRIDPAKPNAKPQIFAKGGGKWTQWQWTKDGDLLFIENRRGYSFLGRFRPGSGKVEWLATGADRLAAPVLSPDGRHASIGRASTQRHARPARKRTFCDRHPRSRRRLDPNHLADQGPGDYLVDGRSRKRAALVRR
jgi:hypothetical protein